MKPGPLARWIARLIVKIARAMDDMEQDLGPEVISNTTTELDPPFGFGPGATK